MDQINNVAINISAPMEVKALVVRWAKEDDRAISSLIRQLIQQEAQRREVQFSEQKPTK